MVISVPKETAYECWIVAVKFGFDDFGNDAIHDDSLFCGWSSPRDRLWRGVLDDDCLPGWRRTLNTALPYSDQHLNDNVPVTCLTPLQKRWYHRQVPETYSLNLRGPTTGAAAVPHPELPTIP